MFNITGSICGDSYRISSSTASCDPACSDYDDSISSYVLSPGGRRYYSPSVGEKQCIPFLNQVHDSLDNVTSGIIRVIIWMINEYYMNIM